MIKCSLIPLDFFLISSFIVCMVLPSLPKPEELNKINNSLQEIRQELDLPEESTQQ